MLLLTPLLLAPISSGTISGGTITSTEYVVTPAPSAFIAPPGDLAYDTSRDFGWKEPILIDVSGWTMYDVTTDLTSAPFVGCSNASAADGADGSDQVALTCAMDQLPSGDCLDFPAGTYNASADLIEQVNICLFTDNAAIIEFDEDSAASANDPCFGGGVWNVCPTVGAGNWPATVGTYSSGGTAGSTSVTLTGDISALDVGDVIRVESTSYPASVNSAGFQANSHQYWGQYVEITGLPGGGVVQFTGDPLLYALGSTGQQVADIEAFGMDHFIVEGFTLQYNQTPDAGSTAMIQMRYVEHVQIRNSAIGENWGTALQISNTYSGLIEGNTFADQIKDSQFQKSTLNINYMAQGIVVQNNQFNDGEVSIELQKGAMHNVIAYNWIDEPNTTITALGFVRCDRGIFLHGDSTRGNLIEGNIDLCEIETDNFWGENRGNFFHANRAFPTHESGLGKPGFGVETTSIYPPCVDCTYLANSADEIDETVNDPFDGISTGQYLEFNLAAGPINLSAGNATSVNNTASATSKDCTGTDIPTSFYLIAQPSWWTGDANLCDFGKGEGEGIGACGDVIDGIATLCTLPAQSI